MFQTKDWDKTAEEELSEVGDMKSNQERVLGYHHKNGQRT